jgi:hypothetical protein
MWTDASASLVRVPLDTSGDRSSIPHRTPRQISTHVDDVMETQIAYRPLDGTRVDPGTSRRWPRRMPAAPTMTSTTIRLAAYDDLGAALLDWDDLDVACAEGKMHVVDAVLVEAADQTIRSLHRFSTHCSARGSVSVSVVGLLQPSSLVSGALAGGIGEQTIATLAGGLDRVAIKQLGDTMDLGEYTIILIAGDVGVDGAGSVAQAHSGWSRAIASTAVTAAASIESIDQAVRLDDPLR